MTQLAASRAIISSVLAVAAPLAVAVAASVLCLVTIEFCSAVAAAPMVDGMLRQTLRAFAMLYLVFFGFGVMAVIAAPIYWSGLRRGRDRSPAIEFGLVIGGLQTAWMFFSLDHL